MTYGHDRDRFGDEGVPSVSRAEAHDIIENCEGGRLVVTTLRPKPAIGEVEQREFELSVDQYAFGEPNPYDDAGPRERDDERDHDRDRDGEGNAGAV